MFSKAAITFDVDGGLLRAGSADIVTASGDITQWMFDGTDWVLIAFMDDSTDMGVDSAGHSDGGNCAAGEIALGVDADGAVEGCYEPAEADISDLAHTATAIQDDLITQLDLNEDSTPDDGDFLTFDSTGTNFEWVTGNLLGSELTSSTNTITSTAADGRIIFDDTENLIIDLDVGNAIRFLSSSGVTNFHFADLDFKSIGEVTHDRVPAISSGTSKSIGSSTQGGQFYFSSGTSGTPITYTITGNADGNQPGKWMCFIDLDATAGVIIDPPAADVFHLIDGTALDAGDKITTVGGVVIMDRVCIVWANKTDIYLYDIRGAWTDGGA